MKQHPDSAFMGITHALSALAGCLLFLALAPKLLQGWVDTPAFTVLLALTICGASMLPDLDNTNSRAESDLGIFGKLLSAIFRGSSSVLQTIIRAERDDPTPNPHRGFWHTPMAALLTAFLLSLLAHIPGKITIFGSTYTYGFLCMIIIATLMTHLTFSSLTKKAFDKIKKDTLGELLALGISLFTVIICVSMCSQKDVDNLWLISWTVGIGMFIHILGDCFTVWGTPLLFPIPGFTSKKKFWWCTSFLPIKAGGAVENYVFIPLFSAVALLSFLYMVFF